MNFDFSNPLPGYPALNSRRTSHNPLPHPSLHYTPPQPTPYYVRPPPELTPHCTPPLSQSTVHYPPPQSTANYLPTQSTAHYPPLQPLSTAHYAPPQSTPHYPPPQSTVHYPLPLPESTPHHAPPPPQPTLLYASHQPTPHYPQPQYTIHHTPNETFPVGMLHETSQPPKQRHAMPPNSYVPGAHPTYLWMNQSNTKQAIIVASASPSLQHQQQAQDKPGPSRYSPKSSDNDRETLRLLDVTFKELDNVDHNGKEANIMTGRKKAECSLEEVKGKVSKVMDIKETLAIGWKESEDDLCSDFSEEPAKLSRKKEKTSNASQGSSKSHGKRNLRSCTVIESSSDSETENVKKPKVLSETDFGQTIIISDSDEDNSETYPNEERKRKRDNEDLELCCIGLEELKFYTEVLRCIPCGCSAACSEHGMQWTSKHATCNRCRTPLEDGHIPNQWELAFN